MSQRDRKLVAIMFTDTVGFTALSQEDEANALKLLEYQRRVLRPLFQKYKGQEIKTIGDAFLVEFPSALDALNCAHEIQRLIHERNRDRAQNRRINLRIGIHLGDVIHEKGDVFGDTVNIASRIQPLARPGGICITQQVYDQVQNKVKYPIVPLGRHELKNVEAPIGIYLVAMPWEADLAKSVEAVMLAPSGHPARGRRAQSAANGVSTGIGALDSILTGGYPEKSTIMVGGPPGIGKEALGYWFTSAGLTAGDFCIYVTRLPVREVLHDMKAFGIVMDQKVPFWLASEGGYVKYEANDLAGLAAQIGEALKQNSGRRTRIVLDVFSYLFMLNPPEAIYKFLSQFLADVKHYDVVVLATFEDGMQKPELVAALQALFDGVVEMRLYEEGPKVLPLLRVRKMRGVPPIPNYFSFGFARNEMLVNPYVR